MSSSLSELLNKNKESEDNDDEKDYLNYINDILLMKFCSFYSLIIQSFLIKTMSLLHTIKREILASCNNNNSYSPLYLSEKVLPIICAFSGFQIELIEILSADLITHLKYINTSTDAHLSFKIEQSNKLFNFWLTDFPSLLLNLTQIDASTIHLLDSTFTT